MENREKPYTTGEIASMSHVTINAVKKWINSGKLSAFRTPGGHFRVKREDFKDFVTRYRFHVKDELFPEKSRILIADDDPDIVNYLKRGLELKGEGNYEIEGARDGYEALIKIGSFKPDLLVLDIMMPRINGVEVCRRLRADKTVNNVRILAITAFGEEEVKKIMDAGADYCLPKPFRLEEFQEIAVKLLKSERKVSRAKAG